MRFAYIDSQGNEVPIPSVDALALRIELGAIGPDTQLYDAQADRWGPASSHEIFHTLSRARAERGFVAPPPQVPTPAEGPEPAVPTADAPVEPEVPAASAPEPEAPVDSTAEPEVPVDSTAGPEPGEGAAEGEGGHLPADRPVFDLSDEFILDTPLEEADGEADAGAGEREARRAGTGAVVPGGDDIELDLTLTDPGSPPEGEGQAEDGPPEAPVEEETFDFGGFGDLELEPTSLPGEPPEAETTEAPPSGDDTMFLGGSDQEMDLTVPGDLGGDLELEPPMSEFTPDSPPAWMDPGGRDESADEGTMRFGSGQAVPPEEEEIGRASWREKR